MLNLETVQLASQVTKGHLPVQYGWWWVTATFAVPLNIKVRTARVHFYAVFFNKYSQPFISADFVSTGFTSTDSTSHKWKTVFSHSQMWFPNHTFPTSDFHPQLLESIGAKGRLYSQNYMWIFSCAGIVTPNTPGVQESTVIKGVSCSIYCNLSRLHVLVAREITGYSEEKQEISGQVIPPFWQLQLCLPLKWV